MGDAPRADGLADVSYFLPWRRHPHDAVPDETEDELDLLEARRRLLEERDENARLRAQVQQLKLGVRSDEDVITP
jgi:hypothetical protein